MYIVYANCPIKRQQIKLKDTKGTIRSHQSKKGRHHNGQKKKD